MDLMTLAAKITLDDSSYTKGIKNAESMGQQLAGKMSSMTVAVGNIMADLMRKGVQAISGVVNGAIDGYADYQQLIGGVETLFKTSSDKVANYAKQSFKNTGLSANEYMETVTSFSASLLQGLGGNTEAAADIANTAVQDMADNANKMGTDIGSIQAAYMGFAKQNYTMLDNLKLGYGGTASEMVRLINDSGILEEEITDLDGITFDQLVQAIHKVQTNLGITGTTAKEAATTILGSAASMKAAWKDMLSAVGGEGDQSRLDEAMENFKASFVAYMENYIPSLVTTISNSGSLVTAIAEAIGSLPTDLLSKIGEVGLDSGAEMIKGVGTITKWLIDSITDMFKTASLDTTSIQNFGTALGEFLGSTISDLVANAPAIIEGIFNAGVALAGSFIEGLFSGIFGLGNEVDGVKNELEESLGSIEFQTSKANAILNYMDELIQKYGSGVEETDEWKRAQGELNEILSGSDNVFEDYGSDVQGAVDKLRELNKELKNTAIMNALQKASQEELELLTRQTLAYNEQGYAKNQAESQMRTARQDALDYIMQNASAAAETYKTNAEAMGMYDPFVYKRLAGFAEGVEYDNFGNKIGDIENYDWDGLRNIIADISDDSAEAKTIIDANEKLYKEAQQAAEDAQKEMDALQKEIDATKETIAATEQAMAKTYSDLVESGDSASEAVKTAGDTLSSAISTLASKIAGINVGGFWSSFFGMPRAVGMEFVPYNGFRAELHRGEAVLTAEENAKRMNGGVDAAEFAAVMEDALITAMNRVSVNMSGEKVGDLTAKRIKNNINDSSYARMRSLGG